MTARQTQTKKGDRLSSIARTTTRRQKVEAREQAILESARQIFFKKGYEGARMSEIAAGAPMSAQRSRNAAIGCGDLSFFGCLLRCWWRAPICARLGLVLCPRR